jgi:hypothetical protein
MTSHLYIPDVQAKAGVPLQHLRSAGRLMVKRKPEVVIVGGDFWDLPSLGTHSDRGSIYYHNKAYVTDLQAGIDAMEMFLKPLEMYNATRRRHKKSLYKPRLVFTLGNHEYRRNRLEEQQPMLIDAIPKCEDYLWSKGFEVVPYRQHITIEGVTYSHNCPQTSSAGCVSRAHLIAQKRNSSWVVGHSQILDYFVSPHLPRIQCLIMGAFYQHDEEYKTGSNDHFRGCAYLHDVSDGSFDLETITIDRIIKEN